MRLHRLQEMAEDSFHIVEFPTFKLGLHFGCTGFSAITTAWVRVSYGVHLVSISVELSSLARPDYRVSVI